ncbi:MAG: cytochrome d ubiquinol oxidase subunit II [Holophagales bacterium]|jgi:cytochrome d ubiquinol oxidase subunit II|nr:cytochrome d ubiquinol oxidase subunit II [Holophagales bacterium]
MLETIWFAIWGVAWAVYFMLDGFDLGLGTLFPFLAKDEFEKRAVLNSMGPFWDGNEVWLITAGGVTFAAFPTAYAIMFSGLYTPLMLLLFALILRGVVFEFRRQIDSPAWKRVWDTCLVVGSFLPALLLGVAFANIFMGLPLDKDGLFQGNLFTLLNPYGLVGGITFVLVFCVHGAIWLSTRTQGQFQAKAVAMAKKLWIFEALLAVVFLVTTAIYTPLWANVLAKPYWLILPLLAVLGLFGQWFMLSKGRCWRAWFCSSLLILGVTLFGVAGMFPNLLLSSENPAYSVTAFNSASSPLTLKIMLGVVVCFLPIVIAYQTWVYFKFRDVITPESLKEGPSY